MTEEFEKLFDAYFTGTLDDIGHEKFKTRLSEDPSFAEDYQFYISVKKGVHLIQRDAIRSQIDQMNFNTSGGSIRSLLPIIISIAAIFLLVLFALPFLNDERLSQEELYAQSYDRYEHSISRGSEEVKTFHHLYEKGKYQQFIDATSSLEADAELLMLQAISYLEIDQVNMAKSKLESIPDETALRDRKYWYLGLVALKEKDNKSAINYFETLKAMSNYKKDEVKKILEHLEEIF